MREMGNKAKEEEKLERTIRGLSKLPENRRCINCNSLGPQYVCTTFNTFICQNCSGIHREFTHRVKSISMAKFSQEEVSALQTGGNERARRLYFKDWDPQRQFQADSSNMYKLRNFIKNVYVDRRYTGERSFEQLPRLRLTDKEEFTETRKYNGHIARSVSPRSEDRYDRHHSGRSSPSGRSEDGTLKYYYDERRSPRFSLENSRSGGYKRSPAKFEVVDDRFRDEYGSGWRSLARRLPIEESRLGSRSPENQRNGDECSSSSTPTKNEMSGHDAGMRSSATSANVKKVPSSGNLSSTVGNEAKQKSTRSEISGNAGNDKKPTEASVESQKQQVPTSADNEKGNKSKSPARKSTLEELLFELIVPAPAPHSNTFEGLSSLVTQSTEPQTETQTTTSPGKDTSEVPTGIASETAEAPPSSDVPVQPSEDPFPDAQDNAAKSAEPSPGTQQNQPPSSPPKNETSQMEKAMIQPQAPSLPVNNEEEPPSNTPNNVTTTGPETSIVEVPQQPVATSVRKTSIVEVPQQPAVEQKPKSTRKELPADLFTALHSPVPTPTQVWQTSAPHGLGLNMQYYPQMMPSSAYSGLSKSTNPFDLNDDANETQGPTFPSLTSLQGALPYPVPAPSGFVPSTSQAVPSTLMQPCPPASLFLLNQSPYASGSSHGMQIEHHGQSAMQHFGMHGFSGYGNDPSASSALTTHQQMTENYSAPGAPSSFPSSGGGNPFE